MSRSSGYTLVELLIVITVLIFLVGVVLPNIKDFNLRQSLVNASEDLKTKIKNAQNNAISGYKCGVALGSRAIQWSLIINDSSGYTLQPNCQETGAGATSPMDRIDLPDGVIFDNNSICLDSAACQSAVGWRISFDNISGTVNFYNPAIPDQPVQNVTKARLILKLSRLALTKEVYIEKGGSIYTK